MRAFQLNIIDRCEKCRIKEGISQSYKAIKPYPAEGHVGKSENYEDI